MNRAGSDLTGPPARRRNRPEEKLGRAGTTPVAARAHSRPSARTLARSSAPPVCPACLPARPRAPSSPNVHVLAPEHSSKRSTESPDSRTLPRLFPRIPRQEIIRNETGKPRGTPFGPWDFSAISNEK
ncbi:hypothetical protein CRG98_042559 [Punica granatum]|uniref:Uncharacterized protein n=1 Tax=Punica granatum TaxID=22663 RepID=A0A2I0HZB7_PUNGR|nr:hypothetical protein CRG98_042559 [Punica granatum]